MFTKDLRQIVIQNEIKIRTNFLVSSSDLGQFVMLHYFIPLDVSQQLVILYLGMHFWSPKHEESSKRQ